MLPFSCACPFLSSSSHQPSPRLVVEVKERERCDESVPAIPHHRAGDYKMRCTIDAKFLTKTELSMLKFFTTRYLKYLSVSVTKLTCPNSRPVS